MNNNIQSNDSGFSANGRFGRLSYLAWSMLLIFFLIICTVISTFLMPDPTILAYGSGLPATIIIFFLIVYIIFTYLSYVFAIRRLHDMNKTGWLSLVFMIPLVGIFFWIYISCAKGDEGNNQYGHARLTRGWEKVLAWIYIIIFPLSIIILAAVAVPAYQNYVERTKMMQMQIEQNAYESE